MRIVKEAEERRNEILDAMVARITGRLVEGAAELIMFVLVDKRRNKLNGDSK